jgi:hypothetical protein
LILYRAAQPRIVPPHTALNPHHAAPSCPNPHRLAPKARLPRPPPYRHPKLRAMVAAPSPSLAGWGCGRRRSGPGMGRRRRFDGGWRRWPTLMVGGGMAGGG